MLINRMQVLKRNKKMHLLSLMISMISEGVVKRRKLLIKWHSLLLVRKFKFTTIELETEFENGFKDFIVCIRAHGKEMGFTEV